MSTSSKSSFSLGELSKMLAAPLVGNPDQRVFGVAPIASAGANEAAYFEDARLKDSLSNTKAGVVLCREEHAPLSPSPCLIVTKPRLSFVTLLKVFHPESSRQGVHSTAVIGEHCSIHPSAYIGPYVVLGDNVRIGEGSVLHSRVVIYDNVSIGDRTIIHSGVVIGATGFGFEPDQKGHWQPVPQVGSVVIGSDVEIGANTTIDRGALQDTVIGNGVKIDNLVMIGHNVTIGDHTIIAGCTGIAGSSQIGKHCILGGSVRVSDHISIADGVILTGNTAVGETIAQPGIYSSVNGAYSRIKARRLEIRFSQLDEMAKSLKQVKQHIPQTNNDKGKSHDHES